MSGASEAHRGLKEMIDRMRRGLSRKDFVRVELPGPDAWMDAETPAPRHGSADARIYAFAKQMFDEAGPDEASRLADRIVFYVQMFSRGA
jgi:hypothetical protein